MNCPYCDETINAMAKFCPKCGLPLKDDSTVMGAYISDGDGPNWGIIGMGAAAILIIALAVGWLSRPNPTTETVRQEPVRQIGAPGTAPGFRTAAPVYNVTPNPAYQAAARPSMTNTRPRWAYTPPARPAPTAPPVMAQEPAPAAPRHFNLMAPVIQRRPPVVEVAKSSGPEIPAIPADELALLNRMYAEGAGATDEADYDVTPGLVLNNQIVRVEAEGVWVFDPVQERWALRPDAKRRRSTARQPQNNSTLTPVAPSGGSGIVDVVPGL